ncbi:MAG: hypothetical protein AAGG48_28560 [Planctomycetota bacterium]
MRFSTQLSTFALLALLGKGRNMKGLLFYDGPPLAVGSKTEIASIDFALGQKRLCDLYVNVEAVLEKQWYSVSYMLD